MARALDTLSPKWPGIYQSEIEIYHRDKISGDICRYLILDFWRRSVSNKEGRKLARRPEFSGIYFLNLTACYGNVLEFQCSLFYCQNVARLSMFCWQLRFDKVGSS